MGWNVGDTHETIVVDDLKRTQIVQYAGASGDYNPLHTDEIFATKVAGYPSVFAHGMLSMGMASLVLWWLDDPAADRGAIVDAMTRTWAGVLSA